jgi:tripartite-type tricarboxylate transporter receptor subunit TctC
LTRGVRLTGWLVGLTLVLGCSAPAAPSAQAPGAQGAQATAPAASSGKTTTIVVPFAPGGGFDALARQLAVPLQRELGDNVIIQNVPGGGQRLGGRQLEQAPADGHALGYFSDGGLYITGLLTPNDAYDPNAKWTWVAGIRTSRVGIFVGKNSPYKTMKDLLDADRAGTRLRIPHNGVGGGFFVTAVGFVASQNMQNVALVGGYTGTADIVPALVRGDVDVGVLSPLSSIIQFIQSGDLRPLAVLEPQRDPLAPDAPTAAEAGLTSLEDLYGLADPSGFSVMKNTPPDRVAALEKATLAAMKDTTFLDWAKSTGADADLRPMSGADFTKLKAAEYATLKKYQAPFEKFASQT